MALASALVSVMIDAVRKTARPMLRDFGEVAQLQVSRKGPGDFVTAADIRAEDTLYELLMKARPGYGFLGEERGMIEGTDKSHLWIVDPIDGTTNFMHAMPHFAITVGLQRTAPDGSSEIVAGVTYNPVMNELFWAEKGKGCYLNDQRIPTTDREFDLMQYLFRRRGNIVSRETLLKQVWNMQGLVSSRTVDTHISRLRKKLELEGQHGWTLSGVFQHGYRLEQNAEAAKSA